MYNTGQFITKDFEEITAFMNAQNFAIVTGSSVDYPVATHLPLSINKESDDLVLNGHLMRKSDHHLAFEKNPNVLVIFSTGPSYINAEWYAIPAVASTVNYMAVHAKGIIEFLDEDETLSAIRDITEKHIGKDSPASFSNIPAAYTKQMLKAIVGFKIRIKEIEHVFKLSQNRDLADRKNIVFQLEKTAKDSDLFIAAEMKKRFTDHAPE